jgi:hypothetical protein
MAIGDVRPREVRGEDDEDSTRVIPPTSVQNEANQVLVALKIIKTSAKSSGKC